MSDKNCYELPLAPQDLVAIYKEKEEDEDFVLWVDYFKSREKLSAKHIIIYLANTNFKTTFAGIDDDLIKEYITSDFMVDCPLLARILVNIIKHKLQHPLSDIEKQLYALYSEEKIYQFISENLDLVEELIETVASSIPFAICKFYDGLTDEQKDLEVNLKEVVDGIKVIDKPSNCGPNIARLITTGFDAFLLITSIYGLKQEYNKAIFNDSPKYFGKDLYFILCETKITDQIVGFFPPDFLLAPDVSTS